MSANFGSRPTFSSLNWRTMKITPRSPLIFGHMRLDEPDGIPRVRYRLSATMGVDGDIEETLVYVLDVNPDGSPLSTAQVPRAERSHIHVHYLPARRDPADHIAYGANALLGRLLRSVNWDKEREEIQGSYRPDKR